ncbi:ABC transporter ATP-binding protein [Thermoactinospora rubra]|uniref:ABC transporter ATP-binding protein n=1 Tax=Thermoactinospora rubra TaxID=1088767 RepID=UPI001F0AF899|nr:ABC transporter ATP-binding protein [Thermoactinospora rubra]
MEGRRTTRRLSFSSQTGPTGARPVWEEISPVEPITQVAPTVAIRKALAEFWPDTRGVRKLFALGAVLAIAAALCEVAAIGLFAVITDQVLTRNDLGAFWAPAFTWLGLAAVAGLVSFAGTYTTALGAERLLLRLRNRVFAHLQTLSPDFFTKRRLGDLMARLTDDIEAIEELVGSGLVRAFTTVVSVIFFAGAAFVVRWDLALITFALVPAFIVVSKLFAARFRTAAGRERLSNGVMNSVIEESLANQALVQAYNRQDTEAGHLHRQGLAWLRANMTQAWLSGLYSPAVQVLQTTCLIVILGFGAWEIAAGRLTIGGLLAFAAYLAYLYPAIQGLGQLALEISEAAAGSDRVIEILRARPGVTDRPAARPLAGRPFGRIDVEHVTFTYPNRTTPTLADVSFSIEPGELVVVTGPSGAGKSTLAKLLLRFHDPTGGRILLDGTDIRDITRASLREAVTVLQQETLLFSGTVRDNIAYGRPDATFEEIVQAAKLAGAHDFITRLPGRYDTELGQRGRLLSGGQRQRIAIARALLRDAPVLVLDEPMTGLDSATAARIMEPLRRLMAGRTTILITHDLRHVPEATRTIVLEPTRRSRRMRLTAMTPAAAGADR